MRLRIFPFHDPGVPHISLVFREMWDSTALRLEFVQIVKGRPTVAPHISRKTSEIWGTRPSLPKSPKYSGEGAVRPCPRCCVPTSVLALLHLSCV